MRFDRLSFLKMLPLAAGGAWAQAPEAGNPRSTGAEFDARQFGAAGDGRAFDTKAIQAAIDRAFAAGGGRVLLYGGAFLSAPLRLKSNVTLYIESGATLLGSPERDHYPDQPSAYPSRSSELYTRRSLVFAERAENVAILGGGTINGQGRSASFQRPDRQNEAERPPILRFSECRNVRIRDITLRDSAMWVQNYLACENVLIDGISVFSNVIKNNDGIDIDDCSNVRISNCNIVSGDDSICLKSTSHRGCHNVVVTNCTISSECNAFKLGTDSTGGFENISFSNSAIYDTVKAAIALEAVDGGAIERVTISNIAMNNVGCALFLSIGNRGRGMQQPKPGRLRGVAITNIEATGASDIGSAIVGQPGYPVEDVLIDNLRIASVGGGAAELATREIPEYPERYPEFNMFVPPSWKPGTEPVRQLAGYGLYVRHGAGIALRNLDLTAARADGRPALFAEDVADLRVAGLNTGTPGRPAAQVWLRDVRDAVIESCRAPEDSPAFLRVEGARSKDITLDRGGRKLAAKAVELGPAAQPEAVRVLGEPAR